MSIAVSVNSAPSLGRTLLMAIVPIALIAVGAVAFLQFFDIFNTLAVVFACAGMVLALPACMEVAAGAGGKITLAIAANGEISVKRYREKHFPATDKAEIVQMMQGSTLWPFFILLRLRQQNKNTIIVPFFWGSLSPQLFRRLSIACRWLAARNDILQSAHQADSR